jgi:hypothetical protein
MVVKAPPPPPLLASAVTATAAAALAVVPTAPVQVMVKVVSAFSTPVDWLPEVAARVPLQPLALGLAEATQLVVLLELQVRVVCPPEATLLALATRVTVGAGVTFRPYMP